MRYALWYSRPPIGIAKRMWITSFVTSYRPRHSRTDWKIGWPQRQAMHECTCSTQFANCIRIVYPLVGLECDFRVCF